MPSKFFTNTHERNLFDKFIGIIQNMKDIYAFHAVVGYFRSSGYFKLQPYLENLESIKILVGINVDQMFSIAQRKGMIFFGEDTKTKEEFLNWFVQDIKDAQYSEEVEKGVLKFVNDLVDGRIEVRAHNSKNLHAKFYLFLPQNHTEHSDGWVIMGSSNLSEAGLGIKKTPNYEMNIALKDFDEVNFAKKEFDSLWGQSTPILPADIIAFKIKTHIDQIFTPYELYLKFLVEYFGKNIDYDPDTVGDLPKTYKKLSYQIDAVNQGFQMLLDHNGFFLADVVGLGKTVVAAMIAKRFLLANGSLNTKILVVYPPSLDKNWKSTFRLFGIDKHTKFITNGRLDKIVEGTDVNYWVKEDYDLVLVDEAHRYRNHTSHAFGLLQRICKAPRLNEGLVHGKKKKVILVSATPLNNRPQDLYYQLLLFQDARRSTLQITNLQSFFGPVIRTYREIIQQENPDINRIREIYSNIREKIISQITVRRTRRDLMNYPKYMDDMLSQGIQFPELAPPITVKYLMDTRLGKLFYHTVFYLTDDDKINYYRYQAIRFLNPELRELYYDQAILVSKSLAGIMKTLMIKRLESSFTAFRITLNNLLKSTQRMIQMFENNKVLIAPDLNVNDLMEKGMNIDEIESMILKLSIENPRNSVFLAEDFDSNFITGLRKDELFLQELVNDWAKVENDPKLETFFKTLDGQLLNPAINETGKLIIFTESTDTANYLTNRIEEHLNTKILNVFSGNRSAIFETIQENFDANYNGLQKNDFDIMVTTDVLAEGINLHRANVVVNYDTPWNSTRLMQRIGRVNRIGSNASVIYNFNFYPSPQGDEEIKLYNNALIKLQAHHTAFGEDAKIFTPEELIEQFELFKEGMPDDEDRKLYYLRYIREFKDNYPGEYKKIQQLPVKARTARDNKFAYDDSVQNSTIAFLKSPYKLEFYLVNAQTKATAISFLEAATIFEANSVEPGFILPTEHYFHVQKAIEVFETEFLSINSDTVTSTDKTDAVSAQAKKFLRDVKGMSTQSEIKNACAALTILVENGTYAALPNELKKLRQQLDKKQITLGQANNILLLIAKKYDALNIENEFYPSDDIILAEISPIIVLSETFINVK